MPTTCFRSCGRNSITVGRRSVMALPLGRSSCRWPGSDAQSIEHWPAIMLLARAAALRQPSAAGSGSVRPGDDEAADRRAAVRRALEEWRRKRSCESAGDEAGDVGRIPGTDQVFNRSTVRGSRCRVLRRVPLLAGGRLLAVTTSSRNAASAFKLAGLAGAARRSARSSCRSAKALLPVRRSLASSAAVVSTRRVGRGERASRARSLQPALSRRRVPDGAANSGRR